ncbi:MAG TPA: hypothetical protein VK816_05110 [Jatrophihabitantaceae bacterium]|nr:hypothetical protein [Jatrophihabitantaceae bacterium]
MTASQQPGPVPATVAAPAGDTSDPVRAVRAQLAELTGLDEVGLAEHVERYQRAHAGLQDALAEIDSA